MTMKAWPGQPYPLGATYDGVGTNFSVFSEIAERVELCLFDNEGLQTCLDLPEVFGFCWHGYLPDVGPGQRYGFRVHGPGVRSKGSGITLPTCFWTSMPGLLMDR
jgi:isoamylase